MAEAGTPTVVCTVSVSFLMPTTLMRPIVPHSRLHPREALAAQGTAAHRAPRRRRAFARPQHFPCLVQRQCAGRGRIVARREASMKRAWRAAAPITDFPRQVRSGRGQAGDRSGTEVRLCILFERRKRFYIGAKDVRHGRGGRGL